VNVHVRAACVIRHVVEHAVETQRGTIGNAETNARESAGTVVIVVAEIAITSGLELVAGASSAGADDELALAAADEFSDREVVVQASRERVSVDIRRLTDSAACRSASIASLSPGSALRTSWVATSAGATPVLSMIDADWRSMARRSD